MVLWTYWVQIHIHLQIMLCSVASGCHVYHKSAMSFAMWLMSAEGHMRRMWVSHMVLRSARVQTHTRMCFRLLEHCRAALKPPWYVVLLFQMLMNALVKSQNLVSLIEPALTADLGALCLGV